MNNMIIKTLLSVVLVFMGTKNLTAQEPVFKVNKQEILSIVNEYQGKTPQIREAVDAFKSQLSSSSDEILSRDDIDLIMQLSLFELDEDLAKVATPEEKAWSRKLRSKVPKGLLALVGAENL